MDAIQWCASARNLSEDLGASINVSWMRLSRGDRAKVARDELISRQSWKTSRQWHCG
jgi:hypothetical protein